METTKCTFRPTHSIKDNRYLNAISPKKTGCMNENIWHDVPAKL